jgi:hypothetical protein
MRVSGNAPQFTISLSGPIVNGFYWVSTGFLPISSGFVCIWEQMGRFLGD